MGRSPNNNSNGPDNAAVAATSCRLRVRGLLDGVIDNICPMYVREKDRSDECESYMSTHRQSSTTATKRAALLCGEGGVVTHGV